jgi:transcriptional regulator with GAF, ATPase, and Fis domain
MVTVNAGGMAEGVFESELFGHLKGSFTDAKVDRVGRFELAMPARSSSTKSPTCAHPAAKLLRVIEQAVRAAGSSRRKVNVRLVSATNADLNESRRKFGRTCCFA